MVVLVALSCASVSAIEEWGSRVADLDAHARRRGGEKSEAALAELIRIARSEAVPLPYRFEAALAAAQVLLTREAPEKARLCFSLAESLAMQTDDANRGERLVQVGMGYFRIGRYDAALELATAAETAAADAGDLMAQFGAYDLESRTCRRIREREKASTAMMNAVAVAQKMAPDVARSTPKVWLAYRDVIRRLISDGRHLEAMELAEESITSFVYGDEARIMRFSRPFLADYLLESAGKLIAQGDTGNALRAYRLASCAFARGDGALVAAAEAQKGIATELLRQGRYDDALAEAKRYFFFSSIDRAAEARELVVRVLHGAGKSEQAEAFDLFQEHGRAGQDSISGTNDDLDDPLSGIPLPVADDLALLEVILTKVDVLDCRTRGYAYLLRGEARKALAEMRTGWFKPDEGKPCTARDVAAALKAVDGNALRAQAYLLFWEHGTAGPDGDLGTADDLADPLAGEPCTLAPERVSALTQALASTGEGTWRRARLLFALGNGRNGVDAMREAFARCSDIGNDQTTR
jgi:tetratricopeptide (TPR) repeat protein